MQIKASIVGLTPILFNNPASLGKKKSRTIPTPQEEAEGGCYWSEDKSTLVFPAWNIYRCFINAASAYKVKRRSLAPFLCGSVQFEPEFLPFNTKDYVIDTRRAVVQRAAVMRSRPRLNEWGFELRLNIEELDIPITPQQIPDQFLEIFREAGRRIGLGDFRLEKKGPFGKFGIADWVVKADETQVDRAA